MGQFIKKADASLTSLRKMRDRAILKRANDPAILWDKMISLLPEDVKDQLILNLASLKITKESTGNYIKAINNDNDWSTLTNDGKKTYAVVANDNYMIIGSKNGKTNQLLFSSKGPVLKDAEIYEDREHDATLMVVFTKTGK